jgi:hypothetical protein
MTARLRETEKSRKARLRLFGQVVTENGGVLYRPASQERVVLAEPPPRAFVEELIRRGVEPLSVGKCVVATWHPHEMTVLEVIRAMSLELQIIFNRNAVMILPFGVKGAGTNCRMDPSMNNPPGPGLVLCWIFRTLRGPAM